MRKTPLSDAAHLQLMLKVMRKFERVCKAAATLRQKLERQMDTARDHAKTVPTPTLPATNRKP